MRVGRVCPHCGARHPSTQLRCEATGLPVGGDPTLVGQAIGGRYALVRLLGDGGMGAVYKAADQVLRRFVAIKLLHASVSKNPNTVERFQREARAAAAIGHPNIIDILDFGHEGQRPYIVMEYLRGQSVSQVLGVHGALSVRTAIHIATHTLAGLDAVHERGILHRDLKPANLMLIARFGDRNFVKICDFGFAALMGGSESRPERSITPERTLVGTPAYAAPERLRGDATKDPRLDVYSLGVVLYEMLAGERPFEAPTFAELAKMVKYDPPPSLRKRRPEIPIALDEVILASLSKSPEARYPTAKAFAEALVPFGGRALSDDDVEQTDSFTVEMDRIRGRVLLAAPAREKTSPRSAEPQRSPLPRPNLGDSVPVDLDSDTERGVRASLASAQARKPRRESDSGLASAVPDVRCEQRMLHAVFRSLETRFGRERVSRLAYESSNAELRACWQDHTTGNARFSGSIGLATLEDLIVSADRVLGNDDLVLSVDCGRAAAMGALEVLPSNVRQGLHAHFQSLPGTVASVLDGLSIEVRQVGAGFGRIEVIRPRQLSVGLTVMLLGFLERLLEQLGGKEVEVNLSSAMALGDSETVIDVSWLS